MRSQRPQDQVYKNSRYEKWIASKNCLICDRSPVQKHHVAHARKNSFLLVPLCVEHHMPGFPQSYHQLERKRFEDLHCVNLDYVIIGQLSDFIQEGK